MLGRPRQMMDQRQRLRTRIHIRIQSYYKLMKSFTRFVDKLLINGHLSILVDGLKTTKQLRFVQSPDDNEIMKNH